MSELDKLRDDHLVLANLFRRLRDIIEQPEPPSQLVLFDIRRELLSSLLAHLKLEDWALYPRLAASADSSISETGRRFQNEMGGLAPAFLIYCDKWSASSIQSDWAGYCSETRGILDSLENRLDCEDRELLPLLERLDAAA
ncbi:MAG TPA: hemerythrin domain-containing protein [Sphingomicrobium sp.]|nr:hemerythrin domain-containing protein [Sphingomicrobium sp.]